MQRIELVGRGECVEGQATPRARGPETMRRGNTMPTRAFPTRDSAPTFRRRRPGSGACDPALFVASTDACSRSALR